MMLDVPQLRAAFARTPGLVVVQGHRGWFEAADSPRFVEFELELHRLAAGLDAPLRRFLPYAPRLLSPEPDAGPFESVLRKATVSSLSSRGIRLSLFTTHAAGAGLRAGEDALIDPVESADLVAQLERVSHAVDATGLRAVQKLAFDPHAKVTIDA